MIPALLALLGTASAFDSVCHRPDGTVCDYGYEPPRNRWLNADSEHVIIFGDAFALSGLPAGLNDAITLRTYASDTTLVGDVTGDSHASVAPVRSGAQTVQSRAMTPAEFAALPDFSFSLYDWITGNEGCDPYTDTGDERCHQFQTHMGALNSSHFLPQSRRFYEHYHLLAMSRAAECAGVEDLIAASDPAATARFESVFLACEAEALVLEAVGQHYLQDAWSSGHMWERWGGPELSDFSEGLTAAIVIGSTSGLIHGAKAVVEEKLGIRTDDPLCAPDSAVRYLDADSDTEQRGGGDLFWDSHLSDPADPTFGPQTRALFGCTINGMREVYDQTNQHHGLLVDADATQADLSRDPLGDACWDQRATNEAMAKGFQLHVGELPGTLPLMSDPLFIRVISGLVPFAPLTDAFPGLSLLGIFQLDQYHYEVGRAFVSANFYGLVQPDGTDMASGGMGDLLGARPNGAYERGGTSDAGGLPADYVDPLLPWGLADEPDGRAAALHLGFSLAHAADRCTDLDASDLEALRDEVAAEKGTSAYAAACGLCTQMAYPLIRIGSSAADYDLEREPICGYTDPGADFVYTGTIAVTGNTLVAAAAWCGCGGRLGVTTRGGSPGLALYDRDGADLDPSTVGSGTSAGDVLPTTSSARAVALGGPEGTWAYVAANDGTLAAFELLPGEEYELDWDGDPTTTDPGAAAGVTRLVLGASPRAVVLTHTAQYGLVTTEEGLSFFAADSLTEVGTLTNADLGLSGSERVYGAAITPDDHTAFVTVWGGTGAATREALVIDLTDLLVRLAPVPAWHVDTISLGAGCNSQAVEVSHAGDLVAVACPDTDQAEVYFADSPYTFFGRYAESAVFEPSINPIDIAWSPDDEAIYVGYVGGPISSTIGTYGTVRRCNLAEAGNCEHAVAVGATTRSISVSGDASTHIVWVADADGGLTPLSADLFLAGSTSGRDGAGLYDGTGGCLTGSGRATPCPASASLGQASGEVLTW